MALVYSLLRALHTVLATIFGKKNHPNSHHKYQKRLKCHSQIYPFEVYPVADYAPNPFETHKT